jgi:hypothetical protein
LATAPPSTTKFFEILSRSRILSASSKWSVRRATRCILLSRPKYWLSAPAARSGFGSAVSARVRRRLLWSYDLCLSLTSIVPWQKEFQLNEWLPPLDHKSTRISTALVEDNFNDALRWKLCSYLSFRRWSRRQSPCAQSRSLKNTLFIHFRSIEYFILNYVLAIYSK